MILREASISVVTSCEGDNEVTMERMTNDDAKPVELDRETREILEERLRTFDEDVKEARPARDVLAELRAKLKPVSPR